MNVLSGKTRHTCIPISNLDAYFIAMNLIRVKTLKVVNF